MNKQAYLRMMGLTKKASPFAGIWPFSGLTKLKLIPGIVSDIGKAGSEESKKALKSAGEFIVKPVEKSYEKRQKAPIAKKEVDAARAKRYAKNPQAAIKAVDRATARVKELLKITANPRAVIQEALNRAKLAAKNLGQLQYNADAQEGRAALAEEQRNALQGKYEKTLKNLEAAEKLAKEREIDTAARIGTMQSELGHTQNALKNTTEAYNRLNKNLGGRLNEGNSRSIWLNILNWLYELFGSNTRFRSVTKPSEVKK